MKTITSFVKRNLEGVLFCAAITAYFVSIIFLFVWGISAPFWVGIIICFLLILSNKLFGTKIASIEFHARNTKTIIVVFDDEGFTDEQIDEAFN